MSQNSSLNTSFEVKLNDSSCKNYDYIYDITGNITEIREGGSLKYGYEYDPHGRLTEEKDYARNVVVLYDYNETGNLRGKSSYEMDSDKNPVLSSENTKTFTYGNSSWTDQLTEYNGQVITYDTSGNPVNYRGGMNFVWERGRSLKKITFSNNSSVDYKYNQNGLRTYKKAADDTVIEYEWDESVLLRERVKNSSTGMDYDIWYLYDSSDNVLGFEYSYLDSNNNKQKETVYYEKNFQGDIIGLMDENGSEFATYSYDAWGNITDTECESGYETAYSLNHIKYRGYYRDEESGFYYLQSRYYDSVTCRFINADDIGYFGASGTVWGYNLYLYGENNPIAFIDSSGNDAVAILSFLGIILVVAAVVTTCRIITSSNYRKVWRELAESIVSGMKSSLMGIGIAFQWCLSRAEEIIANLEKSFARAKCKPNYKTTTETHHIVAKKATRAKAARKVLDNLNIYIDSNINLVTIKTGLHRRLHTKKYYSLVNAIVVPSYDRGYDDKSRKRNVHRALNTLRAFLMALSDATPY